MSPIEIAAALLGVVNVTLVVRRSIWNYPFGLAMVVLYGFVFFEAKLYSDALLQLFFFLIQIYGWWNWVHARSDAGDVPIELLPARERIVWLAICAVATAAWGTLMHRYTDAAYPWWDASVAILSVAAQILMSRRKLENWVLWIAVDLLAIGLYAAKDLWPTVLLYMVFLALSLWGLMQWAGVQRTAMRAAA